ncbi:MAG: DUF1015 domain-containing protein [Polyangiaceae bacterium]|nr:DUF1015 domain-containing protein [Polyangiaceae bacterium]
MAIIHPFTALRPPHTLVAEVAAPPYDVIDSREARALAAGKPHSYLHVSRPEIDLPEGTDEHNDAVYTRGRENLRRAIAEGTLVPDPEPRLYVYAQVMGTHRQCGIVACAAIADYDADVIKKHEKTRQDKEDDRTKHIDELGAHDEPVFLTYRAERDIDAIVTEVQAAAPTVDLVTDDDIGHTLWIVPAAATAALVDRFTAVSPLYVADGHHRSASASRVHARRGGQPGEHDRFMAVIFPHDQMQILPYNRVVRDLRGRSPEALLDALRDRFEVAAAERPAPSGALAFGAYLGGGRWHELRVRPGTYDAADPVACLDASICQDQLLGPTFGVSDPRRDRHVDFVGGIRGARELERRVDEGGWSLALHLHPTSIEQLMAVSDAGLLMPPKSTWFEPKLRSGLFLHTF